MKRILISSLPALVLLLTGQLPAAAQSVLPYVLASSGNSATAPGGAIVNFTIGEPFTSTIGSNPQFTQGFQQPSTSGNPLPVQLLDFSGIAKGGYNLLQWQTVQEKNNDYFSLERSADGGRFQPIGQVYSKAPGGNSSDKLGYSYADQTMPAGTNYYRLRQVDRDGQFSYSKVVALTNAGATQQFSVSPNPTKGKVFFSVSTLSNEAVLTIADLYGRELKRMKPVATVTEIDLSAWTAGTYFLHYSDGLYRESVKVVKD
ncbi:T9SS type A sorting domain-containing protein [Taibaiella koreensis]|uniref:T9SS type A sorting domain-containing protein n=1 Tax=Taibaiella koreensis TaxID=1268548 RepID=UPI000E59AB5F|nr:T9SS type A sorting domain-containing protein [Taibaiella koreensis]